jgi:4-aminobutyrate aminotransferase/(S)-3-amino-2-methylpropionate transaminase
MSHTSDLYERRKKVVPNALGIFNPSSTQSAKGAIITDADGRRLIDFAGGIGVLNAGHCPPPVVAAIKKQAEKFLHTCFNVSIYEVYLELAEKLAALIPHGDHTKVMFTNSGAEAVENAIKIARQATGRQGVICYTGAFHGRTMMAMSLTSKVGYKTGCGPFAPEVYRIDFPAFAHYQGPLKEDAFSEMHLQQLREFFQHTVAASQVAAIVIEIVQGEGGFHVVPKAYLQGLRQICDETGILLIIDEVQTGFGRTGDWAAASHYGVVPDLSTWAKSLGSGMPIGAVMGKAAVLDSIHPGTIGGTYLGNPVCCAAALATIQYMEKIGINAKGKRIGNIVRNRFMALKKRFPGHISNVRGLGAMMAFELSHEGDIRRPKGDLCKRLTQRCYEKGLVLISSGVHGNVIRVLSPLVIRESELREGLDIIEAALEELDVPAALAAG